MNLELTKIDVVKRVLGLTQKSVLEQIKKILDNTEAVGYTTDGRPLTKKAYNKIIEDAEKDILAGNIKSSDDLKKTIRTWKK